MAASNMTTVAYIYKRLYSDKAVGDMARRNHPLFSKMKAEGGWLGGNSSSASGLAYAIRTGNPQGIGANFVKSQTLNVTESKGKQLVALRKKGYAFITLDGEAMAAAEGNAGAFLDLVRQETDGILEEVGDNLAFQLYRSGSGSRGKISSGSGTGAAQVLTLTVVDDARNFKEGMVLEANDTDDATSVRAGVAQVVAVNVDAGTVTVNNSGTVPGGANITALADADFLFRAGDPGQCVEGLASHLPLAAPSGGENFRGIDRSTMPRQLAGARIDDTATSIEENIGLLAVKIAQEGKKADACYLNPVKFWEVVRRLNAKVVYDDGGGPANVAFDGFKIHTPAGSVMVYSDPDCPTNRGYVLNMSTWYIKHLKGLPHIIQDDGRPNLRMASEDSIEARVRWMWNLFCTQPGSNGVFSI